MKCDDPRNGGLQVGPAKRMKDMEKENARLRNVVDHVLANLSPVRF